ncbi:MAG: endolytic transglycosylase MltG [Alphaproteobacteria bacterium]|nr:endolytic transglycosylase MltG [Alphaproteobacteria bacterium]
MKSRQFIQWLSKQFAELFVEQFAKQFAKRPLLFIVIIYMLIVVSLAGSLAAVFFLPNGQDEAVIVTLPRGATVPQIARQLADSDLIYAPILFRFGVRLSGRARQLRAGEYHVPPHISLYGLMQLFTKGKSILHAITIPEGLTSQQIMALLNESPYLDGAITDMPQEGSLLPETYFVEQGFERAALIARMQAAMQAELESLWPMRQQDLPLNSMQEALILASLVEKETGLAAERPKIAAVFLNRLRRQMRLQSDPTIIYGLVGGAGSLGRPLRMSELKRPTPYNTYIIYGLPPSPITNPGRNALQSVLQPADSGALYFVADGTGGHVFADSLEEHNQNVRRWRKISGN